MSEALRHTVCFVEQEEGTRWVVEDAHGSTVRGMSIVGGAMFTVGADQRVILSFLLIYVITSRSVRQFKMKKCSVRSAVFRNHWHCTCYLSTQMNM